jgi:hypothetical protein
MTGRKKRVLRIAVPFLSAWIFLFPPAAAHAKATVIRSIRIGSTPEYVRLVLESDQPLNRLPTFSLKHRTLIVTLSATINNNAMHPAESHTRGIVNLQITNGPGAVSRIQADFSFTPRDLRTFTLASPHRFIIDAYRPTAALPSTSEAAKTNPPSTKVEGPAQQATGTGNHPASVETQRSVSGSTQAAGPPAASTTRAREAPGQAGIPQSLLAALIGVTSTIIVLLFFRICFGNNRKKPPVTSGFDFLPPGQDPEIKHIDAQIAEKMKAVVPTESDQAADRQLACMAEIIRLSHQKSERLNQRLEAVITALEKGGKTDETN